MALGIVKYAYDCSSQLIGVIWFVVSLSRSVVVDPLIIWGQTFTSYLTKLSALQNKAIKLSCGSSYQDYVTPYFKQLGLLKLPDLRDHETAKFGHLHFGNKLPPQLSSNIVVKQVKS